MKKDINSKTINDKELNNAVGGSLYCCPDMSVIKGLELDSYIKDVHSGWNDIFYDIEHDGKIINVGSEDMLRIIAGKVGTNDPRYIALCKYSNGEWATYKGKDYVDPDVIDII